MTKTLDELNDNASVQDFLDVMGSNVAPRLGGTTVVPCPLGGHSHNGEGTKEPEFSIFKQGNRVLGKCHGQHQVTLNYAQLKQELGHIPYKDMVRDDFVSKVASEWKVPVLAEGASVTPLPTSQQIIDKYDPEFTLPDPIIKTDDGACLIREGQHVIVYGDSGIGKTWGVLKLMLNACKDGKKALYMPYESSASKVQARFARMGGDKFLRSGAFATLYGGPKEPEHIPVLKEDYDIIVIDSATTSGATTDGSSIKEWSNKVIAPWRPDKTVIVIDHRPKRSQGRVPGPAGSVAKLIEVDVTMLVEGDASKGSLQFIIEKSRDENYTFEGTLMRIRDGYKDLDDDKRDMDISALVSGGFAVKEATTSTQKISGRAIMDVLEKAGKGMNGTAIFNEIGGGSKRTLQNELVSLIKNNMIHCEQQGASKIYTINPGRPEVN